MSATRSSKTDALRRARWPALLAGATWSALATYFSTAGQTITPLAWVAAVPLLAFAFGRAAAERAGGPRDGDAWARLAASALLALFAGNLSWVALYRGAIPIPGLVAVILVMAAASTGAVLLTGFVAARLGWLAGVLAFPAMWVSTEFAFARLSPHGTAGSLAYGQIGIVPLVQLAAWTGLSGMTFVMMLATAGLAAAVGDRRGGAVRWSALALPVAVLVVALGAGQWRFVNATPAGRVTVGLASIDEGMRAATTTNRDEALAVLGEYLGAAGDLAVRGAEAVVLPEKMIGVTPEYEGEVDSLMSSLAGKDEIVVAAGLNLVGRDGKRNVAGLYAKGRKVLEYEKRHLVPGLERGYGRGASGGIYRAPGGTTGVAICKDLDFPATLREYGNAGVGILFVPAWDFGRDGRLHSRMAVMRGVEGGFSVARAAANGLLTGSDYLGRVVAESPSDAAPRSLVLVNLPLGGGDTFYSRHGDWFAWICVGAAAALIAFAAGRRGSGL